MASKQPSQRATCDEHTDKIAEALCLKHHELLCFQCALDKARNGDCQIVKIQDSINERVHCILGHLCARGTVKKLKENNATHLSKTQELKEKLLQDVGDLHKEYSFRLEGMVQACGQSIQDNSNEIEKTILADNKCLGDHEMQLESNLEKLKDEGASFNECIEQLKTIQKAFEFNERMSEPSGSFYPNETLRESLRENCLGNVDLVHEKYYAVIGGQDDDSNNDPGDDRGISTGSDEVYYSEVKTQSVRPKTKEHKGKWKFDFDFFKRRGKSETHESTATKPTTKPRVSGTEQVSPDVTTPMVSESKSFKLQHIIEKTIEIPAIDRALTDPALKFTKLVHFDKNWFGFLADSTVLVTKFPKGPTIRKKFQNQVCSIAPIGPREIAVLRGQQITTFDIQNGRFTTLGAYNVHETITDVTGFDFDVKSSRYVVSTMSKVMILGNKGKMIKTCTIEKVTVDALHIKSVYDFNSDHVLYLNIDSRTLKSLTCKADKTEVIWKKKFVEEKIVPKDICMYNDICCVACTSSIATCMKTDGRLVAVHDTYDILPDCLAVCVTEGIALWTSGSDDLRSSTHIGCIAV